MNDYSDLLFLIGAIAIYAILVTNTNRSMLQNNRLLTTTEMEYGAISVAQNVIEKARWMSYEQATKQNLENINEDTLYNVEVNVSDTTISESENQNKKINIRVTSPYMKKGQNSNSSVTMNYIKTDRD